MKLPIYEIVVWGIIPLLNFILWFFLSHTHTFHSPSCNPVAPELNLSPQSLENLLDASLEQLAREASSEFCPESETAEGVNLQQCNLHVSQAPRRFKVAFQDTMEFEKFRAEKLASMTVDILLKTYSEADTAILYQDKDTECQTIDLHMAEHRHDVCFAAVFSPTVSKAYNLARVDQDIDLYGLSISNPDPSQVDKLSKQFELNEHNEGKLWPQGFFRKVPKERGRERTLDKLGAFLNNFDDINSQFAAKIGARGIKAGDDMVAMVVNEGELDLFLNFACSCRDHNISLHNIFAFVGSSGIVPLIEATGAMAMFHEGFAAVSRRASTDYLDRVFVDMMWYKAFCIYLVLSHKINVLFQDVDLVWFREPMGYFHDFLKLHPGTEAFFSDDGQRSRRYTPFFANSGFYYLRASPRGEYFAWSIMIAMDAIQVLGSHQNVFTTRLLEGIAISAEHSKLLSLSEFPTGIMYHHHQGYMRRLRDGKVHPYNFHMCWTQGKPDKLIYLRKAAMWYLTDVCSPLENLVEAPYANGGDRHATLPPGEIFRFTEDLVKKYPQDIGTQWQVLGNKCCTRMPNAP